MITPKSEVEFFADKIEDTCDDYQSDDEHQSQVPIQNRKYGINPEIGFVSDEEHPLMNQPQSLKRKRFLKIDQVNAYQAR